MRAADAVVRLWVRVQTLVGGAIALVLRLLLAVVVVEGTASLIGFALALPDHGVPAERERLHLQYDPELGWSHVPDTHLVDFYGPGRHLTINPQGFRASRAIASEPPRDRLRALCVGDSFTLGTGVDDADTWCAQLEALEPRLETVNMGQRGYGVDQLYLWLRRDGLPLEPQLLIVALTREDFGRMEADRFGHYAKPMLRVDDDGQLRTLNVPVPHGEQDLPWLRRNLRLFESLRIVQLAQPAIEALFPEQRPQLAAGDLAQLSARVFEELQRLADARPATLVLVYLPTRDTEEPAADLWRRRIAREARQRGIAFVDLVEEQRALPRKAVARLYIPRGAFDFPGANGHFSEAGNSWIAQTLREHLRRMPELAEALDAPPDLAALSRER